MPRPSLPSDLKHLHTIDILLTQTTEEAIWLHFKAFFVVYEKKYEEWIEAVENTYRKFDIDRNPYHDHNWRKGFPERHYKNCSVATVMNFDESSTDLFWKLTHFISDLTKCNKLLKWDNDTEYSEEFGKMLGTANYLRIRLYGNLDTLKDYEEQCFYSAKRRWEEIDADWIADQRLKKVHYGDGFSSFSGHHPFDFLEFEMKRYADLQSSKNSTIEYLKRKNKWREDEDEAEQLGLKLSMSIAESKAKIELYENGGVPDYTLTCKYCIRTIQEAKDSEEREKAKEEEYERERQHEADERKLEAEKEKERRKALPVIHYDCDLCSFHTTSLGYYNHHTESKDHLRREKLSELFCKVCEVPSRTQAEYDNHCNTTKHRKATGQIEVEPEEYRCTPCEYHCKGKMLWKQHCGTKKHNEKTST